jgi:hypothetical protein
MEAASPVTVDLYRLAFNAGRPVTFDELLDGMPSAYQNDANRWYVERETALGKDIPAEPWSASMLRRVKAEWIEEQVNSMEHTKRFSMFGPNGKKIGWRSTVPRDQVTYEVRKEKAANGQGGPPMVEEEVLVRRMVRWTPEIGATGRRHMKGVQFREAMARIRALGKHKDETFVASKKELGEALELAAEALAFTPKGVDDDG